ncbi:UNVERIFIED_CONTAM: hypothetical protein RMT77_003021 [Armadillidium vulgare]
MNFDITFEKSYLVGFLSILLSCVWAFELKKSTALKVLSNPSQIPSAVENCFLVEYTMKKDSMTSCLSLCLGLSSCLLACKSGVKCRLYEANVSPHWKNNNLSDVDNTLREFSCYSSWADSNDVAGRASYTSSPPLFDNLIVTNAAEGFGCQNYMGGFYFHSNCDELSWILADIGYNMLINKIVIQTRGENKHENYFESVEVRIGSESKSGNFSTYNLVGYFSGHAEFGKIVTFDNHRLLKGRYVSVQTTKHCLNIVEMKIIAT